MDRKRGKKAKPPFFQKSSRGRVGRELVFGVLGGDGGEDSG